MLPRKQTDRQILFLAVVMTLDLDRPYTESELNESLVSWLETTGRPLGVDHVTLRRHLVDEGFLSRDPAGNVYRVTSDARGSFASDIFALDPTSIVAAARAEREARRQAYTRRPKDE